MSLFTSSEVLKEVNITYRQLSYWQLKGIVKPTFQRLGSRDFKRYTQQDIDTLNTVKKLLDEGYSLPATETLKEIAKRKETEEALRESREKYRALAESSVDAIFIHDREGRYLYANQTCTKLFARKPDEIVGKKLTDFFAKGKAKEVLEGIRHAFYKNKVVHIEYSLSLQEVVRYFFATIAPIHSIQGDVVLVMRVVRDITERKKTETALRTSEQKFKDLTETTTDWVWEVDKDGVYTYASPKVKELLGYEISEVLGGTPFNLMPAEEAKKIGKFFKEKVIKKEPFYRLENINRHKDGHLVTLETSGIPLFDEKGRLKGYRGIDRDITERKKVEEKIKLFSQAVEGAIDAVAITDKEGIITYVNPTMERLYGYDKGELIGKFVNALHPDPKIAKQILSSLLKTSSWNGETLQQKKNKEIFPVILSLSTVRDQKGNPIATMGAVRDITERKKAEEFLQKSEEKYRVLTENMKELVYIANVKTSAATYINKAVEEIYGYTQKEWLSDPSLWEKTIYPEDKERVFSLLSKAQEEEEEEEEEDIVLEYRIVTRNKEIKWLEDRVKWQRDEKGKIVGMQGICMDITERKKAEEERERLLTQVERELDKLQTLIDSIVDEVWFCDAEGYLSLANIAAARGLDFERVEEMYRSMPNWLSKLEIYTSDGQPRAQEDAPLLRSLRGEILKDIEEIVRHPKTGKILYRQVSSAPLRGKAGQIMGAVAVVRDITERKKAEKEREKLLHDIGKRAKELDCLYGLSRLVEKVDISLEEIFRGMVNLIPPTWRYSNITCVRIVLEDKEFKTDNYKMTKWKQSADIKVHGKKAGVVEVRYLEEKPESYEGPFLKEERNLIEAIAERLGRITERKKAEEALQRSKELLSYAEHIAHLGSWEWDIQKNKSHCSDEFYRILNLAPREKGLTYEEFLNYIHPQDRKLLKKKVAVSLSKGEPFNMDYRIIRTDSQERIVHGEAAVESDKTGKPLKMIGMFQEITERKKVEKSED